MVAALLIASLCGCQEQRTVEDVFHQGYSAFEADDGATLVRSVRNLERLEPDADHTRLLQALAALAEAAGDGMPRPTARWILDSRAAFRRKPGTGVPRPIREG